MGVTFKRQYDQVKRELTADPQELDRISAAKARAERNWENWLWDTGYSPNSPIGLEDFYREAGIALPRGSISNRDIPTAQQLYEAEQRGRAEELSVSAARKEQQARRERELEALYEQIDRAWYSDDPEWQASHRDADAAREEQRAAKDYREKQERAQQAQDLSTQTAIDEKLAARKHLASQGTSGYTEKEVETRRFWERFLNNESFYSPYADLLETRQRKDEEQRRAEMAADSSTQAAMDEKLAERRYWNEFAAEEYAKDKKTVKYSRAIYNEKTGEIFIPDSEERGKGKWEAVSLKGKIHVDPKEERRFRILSNGMAAVMTGAAAAITKKPTALMLQPVVANLIEAGLLTKEYQTRDYIMNNPHTNEVGISISGAFGARASYSIGIAADCYGNIGIICTPGLGGGTPSASVGMYSSWTNAPHIDKLSGESVQLGGSVGAGFLAGASIGADVIGFYNKEENKAYYGFSSSVGVTVVPALLPVSAEGHGDVSYSTIKNMINLLDVLAQRKEVAYEKTQFHSKK